MMEVSIDVKHQILTQKLQLLQNTYYSHTLDAKIAETLGDQQMLQGAKEQMAKCLRAIDLLEGKLTGLSNGVTEVTNDET